MIADLVRALSPRHSTYGSVEKVSEEVSRPKGLAIQLSSIPVRPDALVCDHCLGASKTALGAIRISARTQAATAGGAFKADYSLKILVRTAKNGMGWWDLCWRNISPACNLIWLIAEHLLV
jgi:hypothetical protein